MGEAGGGTAGTPPWRCPGKTQAVAQQCRLEQSQGVEEEVWEVEGEEEEEKVEEAEVVGRRRRCMR